MILEGFEIENWTCIKKLTVAGLPRTGVIVLHGPNRTGKSSLVQALRACLMDYPSTSTSSALKNRYPRGSGEKPTVSVTFSAGGTTYRVKKCFGSNRSEFASRTSTGDWKVETASAPEVHSRMCEFAGGDDSSKGLRQLLWLTQAEFQLPDAKKFDAGVQAQLRGILGVLQTPLDDRFIERVKKRWNVWYSGQRKAGKQQHIKDSCKLKDNREKLSSARTELGRSEEKFNVIEGLIRQISSLEALRTDLQRQLDAQTSALCNCQNEKELSQARIAAWNWAKTKHSSAVKEHEAALDERQKRTDAASRLSMAEEAIGPAQKTLESASGAVNSAAQKSAKLRNELTGHREQRREIQEKANRIAANLAMMTLDTKLNVAKQEYKRAQAIDEEIKEIEGHLAEHPAPDDQALQALKINRQRLGQLSAEQNAASINLSLTPQSDAADAELAIDDAPQLKVQFSDAPFAQPVRRKAALRIPGWGLVEIRRGTGSGDLDQIEHDLQGCEKEFAEAVALLGISANDPNALDLLVQRGAEHRQRRPEVIKKKRELKQLAPQGLGPLHATIVALETKLADSTTSDQAEREPLPTEQSELEMLAESLKGQIDAKDSDIGLLEDREKDSQADIDAVRHSEDDAREASAACKAIATICGDDLKRCRTEEQIAQRVDSAARGLESAEKELRESELTIDESTIEQRLSECDDAVTALEEQIRENDRKYNTIKGRLEESEGLHSRRAAIAARVDELTRLTESESIEKDAVDRLYELFEECREKQLGTLMGPVHDRVLNWMRVLDIGDYKEVRFSDAFLPDKLLRRDGTAEFAIDEESTGAQEQIGMLVRLALGSLLTSVDQPTVAILDDPLTHCDVGRLNKMRAILRRAAEGDAKQDPPVGQLQIIVLTCHPEWFRDERATVIDLENADVMQRLPV